MARHTRSWPVLLSFVIAVALEILPLPSALQALRPPLPAMVLIYWAMMWPQRFGLLTGFSLGLILDVLHGQILGQNALALSVVAYLTVRFHLQIRIFPLWQLTMTVFALLACAALLRFLAEGIAGMPAPPLAFWLRVISGAVLWPVVMGILDRLRLQAEARPTRF